MSEKTPFSCARVVRAALLAILLALLTAGISGCGNATFKSPALLATEDSCGGSDCHDHSIEAMLSGPHAGVACVSCHEGAGEDHSGDPEAISVSIDWTIDGCAECHQDEAATYLYDDNLQVGPFGGSQRTPPLPKADTFPLYGEVVAGHPFAKEYNEEGAHAFMLEDHYETTRGKYETCVQCKSTKVAWAWDTGNAIEVIEDAKITLTHTATATETAKVVTVPAGTMVEYRTDPVEHLTLAKATLPDGTVYTSYDDTEGNGTKDFDMMWAATIAATSETMPYGAGCNHCHDPHSAAPRIVRHALRSAIERGGINPYKEDSARSFDEARSLDQRNTLCSQCHVEYVCGKSGVDGIDRDFFSWAKAYDLHALYDASFGYSQDWTQKTTMQPLIKSQHPETELHWNSTHYQGGASCVDCHMPQVRRRDGAGEYFTSHWFTSPYKYQDPATFSAFAGATGIRDVAPEPCGTCHSNRQGEGIAIQQAVYERQEIVQGLLAQSSALLGEVQAASDAGASIGEAAWDESVDMHRQAHVLWENLIVSENSMGFHNHDEVMDSMIAAEEAARRSIAISSEIVGK